MHHSLRHDCAQFCACVFTPSLINTLLNQHTVSLYIHEGAQWGQSSATTQKMLDAANSMSPLYDLEKFNLFSNGFARKLSNVEFSALMVGPARACRAVHAFSAHLAASVPITMY
jgi:hypothetical protein